MRLFDEDISVVPLGPGMFKASITDNWSINGNPNGGYLMALLANAMMQTAEKRATPVITANFLSRAEPGPAEIHLEKIAESNQFDRIQASLIQGGKERIRSLGTFARENSNGVERRYEKSEPEIAPLEDCVIVPEMPSYSLFRMMDVRLDPAGAGWMMGSLTQKSEIRGWIRFRDERPFDTLSTILIADSFPPPILVSQGLVAWVPSIEFSVSVRNPPKTKWLKGVFRTCFVDNGILEEDGEIWDGKGELLAISRQIAQFRNAAV
jgi:acyl-CoA thioesterase